MKTIIVLLILLLLVGLGVKVSQNYFATQTISLPFFKTSTATVNNNTIKLYVAKTDKEKQTGLSDKTSLPQDYGMVFSFGKADYYPFWMHNMKFPIDIIYIRGSKVVDVFPNRQPTTEQSDTQGIIRPQEPADMVLEINAGQADKYGIKRGDEIKFSL